MLLSLLHLIFFFPPSQAALSWSVSWSSWDPSPLAANASCRHLRDTPDPPKPASPPVLSLYVFLVGIPLRLLLWCSPTHCWMHSAALQEWEEALLPSAIVLSTFTRMCQAEVTATAPTAPSQACLPRFHLYMFNCFSCFAVHCVCSVHLLDIIIEWLLPELPAYKFCYCMVTQNDKTFHSIYIQPYITT